MQHLLTPENTGEGRPSKSNRVMLNGMLWKVKTGAPWRDLPERFGPWKTVYSRFRLWSKDDLFYFKMLSNFIIQALPLLNLQNYHKQPTAMK
ncbi:hypothetical protein B9T62_01015 [Paenibacillus donghaensis]|uniref:Insertion element IS402-like domain-containing protein n=1 Tax=Paenibacillus donghaensis TaxID=414771 RepID=A0A2Z2K4Y5_9BACL|nr:hypothetical protein B9T62_01015 [Paenibacillus donghaensis]